MRKQNCGFFRKDFSERKSRKSCFPKINFRSSICKVKVYSNRFYSRSFDNETSGKAEKLSFIFFMSPNLHTIANTADGYAVSVLAEGSNARVSQLFGIPTKFRVGSFSVVGGCGGVNGLGIKQGNVCD